MPEGMFCGLCCGNRDDLIGIGQDMHAYVKEQDVPHVCNVDSNGHDAQKWRTNLYQSGLSNEDKE
jgi:hypothetical protein